MDVQNNSVCKPVCIHYCSVVRELWKENAMHMPYGVSIFPADWVLNFVSMGDVLCVMVKWWIHVL
jgi:hypothetical protein